MPRKKIIGGRAIIPDPKYNHPILTKFINAIMLRGQKLTAYNIVYNAMERASKKLEVEPITLFEKVIENTRPIVAVKSLRIGGATYQVPESIQQSKGTSMCIRWIVTAARNKKNGDMITRLSDEMADAYGMKGAAVKKKEDTHRMAESNRAFAHLIAKAKTKKSTVNRNIDRR